MLTEIEWWGGLIFVLGAITHRLVTGALDKKDEGIDWHRWQMHGFFVLPAVVLAGYFYPLAGTGLQYAYLGVLGAALLLVAVMLVQEVIGDAGEGSAETTAEAASGAAAAGAAQADDESPGWLMTLIGVVVLYSPVLVACGLGCAKAWPMVQGLL
ncbi:hypothetical protein [Acidovorax sp. Q11]